MLIINRRGWEIPEAQATPETVALNRRSLLLGSGAALATPGLPALAQAARQPGETRDLYPVKRNEAYGLDRALTPEEISSVYNNFYEFGSSKRVAAAAQALETHPWTLKIGGMVEKPFEIAFEDLVRKMPLEERLYRHRCVEAWAMAVPWSGFPLRALLDLAKPLSSAKYIAFKTFLNPKIASGQRQTWYPWPYTEGLAIDEAANELAFMVTGAYGKPLHKSFGAPIRLALPWKYGFKHIKSITDIVLTDQRPKSFWEALQPAEYGFWANVNPQVPHPRWSQASEELLGENRRVPTQIYNGYGSFIASLYTNRTQEKLFI
jgi:methionine sulfoxide reductase catalytic subunit